MKRTITFGVCLLAFAIAAVAQSERTFAVPEFQRIQFDAVGRVEFTQGQLQPVRVTGPERDLRQIEVKVVNGTLIIKEKEQKNKDRGNNGLQFQISAPLLTGLSIDGVCTFKAKRVDAKGDFNLSVDGVASVDIPQLLCRNFSGSIDGVASNQLNIDAQQEAKLDIDGVTKGNIALKSDVLRLDIDGVDKTDYTFHGREARVTCGGVGKNRLTVDCEMLHARADGVSNMTLAGTADKVDFGTDGVSKFNTKDLNKF